MAWMWVVGLDALLGVWVLCLGVYLLGWRRSDAARIFGAGCFVIAFRLAYFVWPPLFGGSPSNALALFYQGSEDAFGVALVGTGLAYRRARWTMARIDVLAGIYVAALAAILLLVSSHRTTGFVGAYEATMLPLVFSTATLAAAWPILQQLPFTTTAQPLLLVPIWTWSLNDALRVGVPLFQTSGGGTLGMYARFLSGLWLVVLAVTFLMAFARARRDPWLPWSLLIAAPLTLLQFLGHEALDHRALHIVIDCAAITMVAFLLARRRDVELEEGVLGDMTA